MVTEFDVQLNDSTTVHAYDTSGGVERLAVFWHHGTPNIGAPPRPLFETAERLGMRWVSFDRPGYGGSTPMPGRDVASAAMCAAAVADELGIDEFAVVGHSGGGPHALACAALLPERVRGVISIAGLAPFDADGLDWFAGMIASGVASLRAAAGGREAKVQHTMSGVDYDPEFTELDLAALADEWGWLGDVVGPAVAGDPGGLIDDDLAYVNPWGFDPAQVRAPALFVHGGMDGIVPWAHSQWLAARCPAGELRLAPDDGHVSVLDHASAALEWLSTVL
jgi:pimeloyl-ACP methyl ester carboxylesterase